MQPDGSWPGWSLPPTSYQQLPDAQRGQAQPTKTVPLTLSAASGEFGTFCSLTGVGMERSLVTKGYDELPPTGASNVQPF